ncbi:hypothetical protein [Mucilaginibacter dorajii]|uniref:hypothetical protein n=1 Tax=Mucilaginibacter dorajii TaxID=692994 RepID=UPI002167C787|nr:hypothetical protein [Mucilaginibacter dorajii]MCS3732760.1 hypothetical protein [Mucilaginibacter dorajii]
MAITTDKNWQLCNRLFHFGYFIANPVEYGIGLFIHILKSNTSFAADKFMFILSASD